LNHGENKKLKKALDFLLLLLMERKLELKLGCWWSLSWSLAKQKESLLAAVASIYR
jgi:hypothetical protein